MDSETPSEFATLQNVVPDQTGLQKQIFGKRTKEKQADRIMGIHQFWSAYGYGARLIQSDGGIISDPEEPPPIEIKIPIIDIPLHCRSKKPFANKLKLQYLNKKSDFIHASYNWTKCDGNDFDSRTALIECSIGGVLVYNGTVKQAIVGYFTDGTVLEYRHLPYLILGLASDTSSPTENVIVNLRALRDIAGDVEITAKFSFRGYFYSYLGDGNVRLDFHPYEKGRRGDFEQVGTSWEFPHCTKYKSKTAKRNIVTQTTTPILTTGDLICYMYVHFYPKAQKNKDRIWIDDR